ncbi:phosphatase PAP2 family protein [Rufibacter sediminis]|uniref:Phosphatase PAP2 family protein n=1 Tax=Rufibacter sediminis TaxID=2762756 RepID=A0ABR6VMG8_9BACT|nr:MULTISPECIES: phosphatase PAP2 family protein [Rufibacter]MBC3538348.1 phosphatase PAP2 family protein [Rufibacter sediminis]
MKKILRLWFVLSISIGAISPELKAQEIDSLKVSQETVAADTLKKYQDSVSAPSAKAPFFKSKAFKATIIPALLIGYGLSTVKDNGLYSSYDAKRDIQRHFPNFKTTIDNPLLIAPYVELALANLLNVKSKNDFLNTGIVILKAEAIFAVTVYGLKQVTDQERPNGENRESMPSGHAAQAFLAASILNTELKHKSPWYGVGAYTIATSVGVFRMLNNKHWQSDVFVGAGIGMLSSHLAYLSHRNRWGRKPSIVASPTYIYGVPGFAFSLNLDDYKKRKNRPDLLRYTLN